MPNPVDTHEIKLLKLDYFLIRINILRTVSVMILTSLVGEELDLADIEIPLKKIQKTSGGGITSNTRFWHKFS